MCQAIPIWSLDAFFTKILSCRIDESCTKERERERPVNSLFHWKNWVREGMGIVGRGISLCSVHFWWFTRRIFRHRGEAKRARPNIRASSKIERRWAKIRSILARLESRRSPRRTIVSRCPADASCWQALPSGVFIRATTRRRSAFLVHIGRVPPPVSARFLWLILGAIVSREPYARFSGSRFSKMGLLRANKLDKSGTRVR